MESAPTLRLILVLTVKTRYLERVEQIISRRA
jgi:hypothetical protein